MTPSVATSTVCDRAYRIGHTAAVAMYCIIPVHFFMPCAASETTMKIAVGLGLFVAMMSIIARRLRPFVSAVGALVLHGLGPH